jgi:DNA polymerase III alpha subunit
VNESDADFTVSGADLRFGLVGVKGVGWGAIRDLCAERAANGPFRDFEDFCRRMSGKELNRRAVENLIRAGAFDSLGHTRRALLQVAPLILDAVSRDSRDNIEALLAQLTKKNSYRRCFLLPERDKLVPLPTANIAYAYIEAKTVKLVSMEHKEYYLTQTLDDLMAQLDPKEFFRANRQFVISRSAVKDVSVWFGNKLAINLIMETPEKIIVSKARVAEFKHWFSN